VNIIPTTPGTGISRRELAPFVQWDIPTWTRAIEYWTVQLASNPGAKALEIGSRDAQLASVLSQRFDLSVVCTELYWPHANAAGLAADAGADHRVGFCINDARRLPFPDNTFDVLLAKSVLGGIAGVAADTVGAPEGLRSLLTECARVVRPGGLLLVAEGVAASSLHRRLRATREWNRWWHYPSLDEFTTTLSEFGTVDIHATGLVSAMVPDRFGRAKTVISGVDEHLSRLVPARFRYLAYGSVRVR
jgi:SAM-dependent methyltransferase